jgi:hypothetical protein
MATALHVQTPGDFSPAAEYSSPWLDRAVAPREEAVSLFALIGRNGDTVESVRELIAVPPRMEAALLLYAERNPEDARGIERVLEFRRRVAEEFERLQEQKRETTFPIASGNGLRTQPTGGAGTIIEIPVVEAWPDGAA